MGDDLFVTNTERLKKGIELGAANAILDVYKRQLYEGNFTLAQALAAARGEE